MFLLNLVGIFFLLLASFWTLFNQKYGLMISVALLIGNFGISWFDFQFLVKLLIIINAIILFFKNEKKHRTLTPLIICLVMGMCNFLFVSIFKFNMDYGPVDFLTSYANILMGILLFYIQFDEKEKIIALKQCVFLPFIAVFLGIILRGHLFINGRIVSLGLFSHLPFWCGFSFISATTLAKSFNLHKYLKYGIASLLIVALTQSRGGAIFAFILAIPLFFDTFKHLKKRIVLSLLFLFPFLILFLYHAILILWDRTFQDGVFNSTNRFAAWQMLLKLSNNNRLLGMGIGSLKSITGNYIISMGFNAAHNEYIRFIYETGVIGLFCFLAIMGNVFFSYKKNNILNNKKYIISIIASFYIYSITDNTVSAAEFWAPFMFIIALQMDTSIKLIKKKCGGGKWKIIV